MRFLDVAAKETASADGNVAVKGVFAAWQWT
jgi:hypothetical protein